MKPAREVIEEALRESPESDARWDRILALHRRGDEETFAAAAALLDSFDADRRALGADVLAQLGATSPTAPRPLAARAGALLVERIAGEAEPGVLASMATAFGHLQEPRAVPALHALRAHPDADVREAVAYALLGQDDDVAVETLIELSRDPVARVRDWATLALGAVSERDEPRLRAALLARLDDPDDEVCHEALRGLAARGDERAIAPLLAHLERHAGAPPRILEDALFELATRTRDPRLHSHLGAARRDHADRR